VLIGAGNPHQGHLGTPLEAGHHRHEVVRHDFGRIQ
jgi:hypothetical protein